MDLDYRLSEEWDDSINLVAADETDLRYYAANGDVILRKDQTDLSARWGWIPLIDFALALREIVGALEGAVGSKTLEFTESDATLQFGRREEQMTITSSYVAGEINVPFTEFSELAQDFARRLDAELLVKRPELGLNPVYQNFKLSGLSI